jgi:hypothetical protein
MDEKYETEIIQNVTQAMGECIVTPTPLFNASSVEKEKHCHFCSRRPQPY